MSTSGGFGALVVLRAKQGEFAALHAVDERAHVERVQPLLEFIPNGSTPAGQLDGAEAVARRLHGLGRTIMVDAAEVTGAPGFGAGPVGALGELADRLAHPVDLFDEQVPVPFIPVVRGTATAAELPALGRLCQELGAGGALRIGTAAADQDVVERLLDRLRVVPADLDLIVDLGYLPELPARVVDRAAAAVGAATGCGPFRSVSVLSGSIPRSLDRTSLWEQPRVEERLWRSMVEDGRTDLRLGDYGIAHPVIGEGYRSKHVALRYSCPDHWLYSREREPVADGAVEAESGRARTVRSVCRNLVESDGYAGPEFSWGDREILDAAEGRGSGLGATSKPPALATSHHLAYLAAHAA
ncbi:beta family protein [Saccharopolyspora sp. 6M]|uniref:beta family protein n=1 Tax=Saccharopolyspora sp. 6M TaxID=2877237 RepID=UPI001CD5E281|nr:beta family protein [Saccharopolyspora sp. 6M]MCA1226601.1 beta family protein [Saccharopolyspora sp. 6M]